eukprot:2685230-Pyramimonas_sp.AAC.2
MEGYTGSSGFVLEGKFVGKFGAVDGNRIVHVTGGQCECTVFSCKVFTWAHLPDSTHHEARVLVHKTHSIPIVFRSRSTGVHRNWAHGAIL